MTFNEYRSGRSVGSPLPTHPPAVPVIKQVAYPPAESIPYPDVSPSLAHYSPSWIPAAVVISSRAARASRITLKQSQSSTRGRPAGLGRAEATTSSVSDPGLLLEETPTAGLLGTNSSCCPPYLICRKRGTLCCYNRGGGGCRNNLLYAFAVPA